MNVKITNPSRRSGTRWTDPFYLPGETLNSLYLQQDGDGDEYECYRVGQHYVAEVSWLEGETEQVCEVQDREGFNPSHYTFAWHPYITDRPIDVVGYAMMQKARNQNLRPLDIVAGSVESTPITVRARVKANLGSGLWCQGHLMAFTGSPAIRYWLEFVFDDNATELIAVDALGIEYGCEVRSDLELPHGLIPWRRDDRGGLIYVVPRDPRTGRRQIDRCTGALALDGYMIHRPEEVELGHESLPDDVETELGAYRYGPSKVMATAEDWEDHVVPSKGKPMQLLKDFRKFDNEMALTSTGSFAERRDYAPNLNPNQPGDHPSFGAIQCIDAFAEDGHHAVRVLEEAAGDALLRSHHHLDQHGDPWRWTP